MQTAKRNNKTGSASSASQPARRKRAAPAAGDPQASPDFITALARGLDVLRCFQPGSGALGNQDLARLTGLPKPTISRITYTLTVLGYLRYDTGTGKYAPGYGVLALGFGMLASLEVRELVRPCMEALARETGAAVALGAFDGERMTYLEALHGSPELYLRLPVGHRITLDSAMGRAYLASLPDPERAALLQRQPGVLKPEMVERACREFRETGGACYAIGDWQPGINAVAVAFRPAAGGGTYVMSCGGPEQLLPEPALRERIGPMLLQAVAGLSMP